MRIENNCHAHNLGFVTGTCDRLIPEMVSNDPDCVPLEAFVGKSTSVADNVSLCVACACTVKSDSRISPEQKPWGAVIYSCIKKCTD